MPRINRKVLLDIGEYFRLIQFSDAVKRHVFAFQVLDYDGKWLTTLKTDDTGAIANMLVKSGLASDHKDAFSLIRG